MLSRINKILVLGKTGNGKSTLCNFILGYDEQKFKTSESADRCTTNVNGAISKKYPDIFMIDTPGLSDPHGEDQKIINDIREQLKNNHCNGIKAILLLVNANETRISAEDQRIIGIYGKMFPHPDFWEHVGVVFTKSYDYTPENILEKNKFQRGKDFIPSFHNLVTLLTNEINATKKTIDQKIRIPQNFQYFFTDCGDVDQYSHERTNKEILRILNWTKSLDYLDFNKYDFEDIIESDYLSSEPLDDAVDEDKKPSNGNEREIILTKSFYKRKKVKDFHGVEGTIECPKPYKVEKYFIIKEEKEEKERTCSTQGHGNNEKEIETIQTKIYEIITTLDENRKQISKDVVPKGGGGVSVNIISETREETEYNVPGKSWEEFSTSKHEALKKIEEAYQSLSPTGKVFAVGGVIITSIALFAATLAGSIISGIALGVGELFGIQLNKPQKWKTVYKSYRDEIYVYTIRKDKDGKETRSPRKLYKYENERVETYGPYRVD